MYIKTNGPPPQKKKMFFRGGGQLHLTTDVTKHKLFEKQCKNNYCRGIGSLKKENDCFVSSKEFPEEKKSMLFQFLLSRRLHLVMGQ